MKNKKSIFEKFVIDIDGVMTTGRFLYSDKGKVFKEFGPDDHDALKIASKYINIEFISADKKGFKISKRRIVGDMGFKLSLVSTTDRLNWFKKNCNLAETIYMADSFKDIKIFECVGYSIAPSNADAFCKKYSNFTTKCGGGDRAVSEACFHILKSIFKEKIEIFFN